MKPPIAVMYSLARSGATLISRCIACMQGNCLLSEIHPRWALFDPLTQAAEWFNLISPDELRVYAGAPTANYLDAISLISERCESQGKRLIVRDWTQLDFIPGRYPVPPTYQLSQYAALEANFNIHHIAIVRDPLDVYLSLTKMQAYRGWLSLSTFLAGYRLFLNSISNVGYVRYEDFCENPLITTNTICDQLRINFDPGQFDLHPQYHKVTGDVYAPDKEYTLTGDRIADRAPETIRLAPKRPEYVQLLERAKDHADYITIATKLGYAI